MLRMYPYTAVCMFTQLHHHLLSPPMPWSTRFPAIQGGTVCSTRLLETVRGARWGDRPRLFYAGNRRVLRCLRITTFCWVVKHVNITRPTEPQKMRLQLTFGSLFSTTNILRWVVIFLDRKQTTRNTTQPSSPQAPYVHRLRVSMRAISSKKTQQRNVLTRSATDG